ncbi:MAG: hypothetical protein R6W81_01335 [Bacteroidales bacterium]
MKKFISIRFILFILFGCFDSRNVDTSFLKREYPYFEKLLPVISDAGPLDAEENFDASFSIQLNSGATMPTPS